MDPATDLPVRYVLDNPAFGHLITEEFKDLEIDQPMNPALFVYKPEVQPNTWDPLAYMLKPGAVAPDFTGRLLAGHTPFQLFGALKQNKALLLDI